MAQTVVRPPEAVPRASWVPSESLM
jgi:hypothetical protein